MHTNGFGLETKICPCTLSFNNHTSCRFQHQRSLEGKARKPSVSPITLYWNFVIPTYFQMSFAEKSQHNELKISQTLQYALTAMQTVVCWPWGKSIVYSSSRISESFLNLSEGLEQSMIDDSSNNFSSILNNGNRKGSVRSVGWLYRPFFCTESCFHGCGIWLK